MTGPAPTIEAFTPTIILIPPSKLVLEVKTTGAYESIGWARNGYAYGLENYHLGVEGFSHFTEVYTSNPTTNADLGLYRIHLIANSVVAARTTVHVLPYGMI